MLLAQDGLADNTALRIAPALAANVAQYSNLTVVTQLAGVIALAQGNVANATLANLQTLGNTTIPAITNAIPQQYTGVITVAGQPVLGNTHPGGLTAAVQDRANTITGNNDLSVLAQIYQTSRAYQAQANQVLAPLAHTGAVNATFRGMSSISTGGVSDISVDLPAFGQDLGRLGYLIDLSRLNQLGLPSALLRQTINRGNGGILPALQQRLEQQGITRQDLLDLQTQPTRSLTGQQELAIYQAMAQIQGADLQQVLELLAVTQTGFLVMTDLLDPVKLLPNSYLTMTVPWVQGTLPIYTSAGTVNDLLGEVFGVAGPCSVRARVQPADQALAMQVLARSLQGLQGVTNLTLPELAQVVAETEDFSDLPGIIALTSAVSTDTANLLIQELAPTLTAGSVSIPVSTGANNTFVIYDFIGTAAGYPHDLALDQVTPVIQTMTDDQQLANLITANTGAYATMLDVLGGNLTLIPPWGSGTYSDVDTAMQAVIANTNIELANIAAADPSSASILNSAWGNMATQLIREEYNQGSAQVELDELTANSMPNIMTLAAQLHEIGLLVQPRDSSEFFTVTANTDNIGGQAVIASLREGRNIQNLQNSGLGISTNLPNT